MAGEPSAARDAGATVDGEASTVYAPLVDSPVRY